MEARQLIEPIPVPAPKQAQFQIPLQDQGIPDTQTAIEGEEAKILKKVFEDDDDVEISKNDDDAPKTLIAGTSSER